MTSSEPEQQAKDLDDGMTGWRHMAFSEMKGLGDKVFAFAMTLLAYNLVVPDVSAGRLGDALVAQIPQFAVFAISFAVAANIWWQHHKLTRLFTGMEPLMVGLYFLFLGVVVLVPFAAALVGSYPYAQAAVLPFISLFIVLNGLCVLLTMRAERVGAWRYSINRGEYIWLLFNFIGGNLVLAIAFVLSLWNPMFGLVILAVGAVLGPILAPRSYRTYGGIE